jgi:hypothetical protein
MFCSDLSLLFGVIQSIHCPFAICVSLFIFYVLKSILSKCAFPVQFLSQLPFISKNKWKYKNHEVKMRKKRRWQKQKNNCRVLEIQGTS